MKQLLMKFRSRVMDFLEIPCFKSCLEKLFPMSWYSIQLEFLSNLFINFRSKGLLAFINEKLGEICYDLTLISLDCPLVRLPLLKTSIGK
jgi:hypothetical protein